MRSFIFALLSCILLMSGCETDVNDVTFHEYKELLVVHCSMKTSGRFTTISCEVSRTLPPGETYSLEKAWVTDAVVTYSTESSTRIPHVIPNTGIYRTADSGLVGKTVTLTVSWKGKTATAQQHIPLLTVVDTMTERQYIPQLGWHRVIGLRAFPDIGRVIQGYQTFSGEGVSASSWPEHAVGGMYYFTVRVSSAQQDSLILWTEVWSKAREDYTLASEYSGGGDWFFPAAGKNPRFNVRGDGIGFFYATTRRDTVVVM
ncbi:MAG: DUF4249 family protein [Ignavibacteriae bacterium]|nr:DUF4249 family protein [Ignavibacteriota bacterium]